MTQTFTDDRKHKPKRYQDYVAKQTHNKETNTYPEQNKNMNSGSNLEKGGRTMNTATILTGNNNVLGFCELRNNLSEVMDRVLNNYEVVLSGRLKKNSSNTAAIMSSEALKDILQAYRFNPEINLDETTSQYEVILKEINIYSCGDTEEEAINALLEMVEDSTSDFFENSALYMRIPDMRSKFPYFLRIYQCKDTVEIMKVLNLS